MNVHSFCLYHMISPSYLNEIPVAVLGLACSSLWECPTILYCPEEFLLKDQLLTLWGSNCRFMSFLLVCLMLVYFVFKFSVFDLWWCFSFRVLPVWGRLLCWGSGNYILPHLMEATNFYHFKHFLMHSFFILFFSFFLFYFFSFQVSRVFTDNST